MFVSLPPDDTLNKLAIASSSSETKANLDRINQATTEMNRTIETNRLLLQQQEESSRKAKEHLKAVADEIDQKIQQHDAKVKQDFDVIASRMAQIDAKKSEVNQLHQEASVRLQNALQAEQTANDRLAEIIKREQSVSLQETSLKARRQETESLHQDYLNKLNNLKNIIS